MTDTKFYKLLNLIQKGDKDNILSYAKEHPYLIREVAKYQDEYGYFTPVCILAMNGKSEIAFELAKLNPKVLENSCGFHKDYTPICSFSYQLYCLHFKFFVISFSCIVTHFYNSFFSYFIRVA